MDKEKHSKLLQFRNCRLLKNGKLVREDLFVRDGVILNPREVFYGERLEADIQTDCNDAIICAGFIESQINGAFGLDFSDPTIDDPSEVIKKVSKGLLAHGVTSFCPTLVTSDQAFYRKVIPLYKRSNGSKDGAGVLGLHLEGPFISEEKRGAHQIDYIRQYPNGFQDILDVYGSLDNVSIITLAPELPNTCTIIEELIKRGISVSVGHSVSNLSDGEAAVKAGANYITHLFNAMLPFHHRDPHLVGLLCSSGIPVDRTVYFGIIADGIHTHPSALRIAFRSHPKGIVLVTDAITAMGLGEGEHHLASQVIEVRKNGAYIKGTNTLCGSIATMIECIRFFKEAAGCTSEVALEAASLHPAQMLKITSKKGTLDYNTDADFVILDDELNLQSTYISGQLVWSKHNSS